MTITQNLKETQATGHNWIQSFTHSQANHGPHPWFWAPGLTSQFKSIILGWSWSSVGRKLAYHATRIRAPSPALNKSGVVVHTCNPGMGGVEARSEVQGHPPLQGSSGQPDLVTMSQRKICRSSYQLDSNEGLYKLRKGSSGTQVHPTPPWGLSKRGQSIFRQGDATRSTF